MIKILGHDVHYTVKPSNKVEHRKNQSNVVKHNRYESKKAKHSQTHLNIAEQPDTVVHTAFVKPCGMMSGMRGHRKCYSWMRDSATSRVSSGGVCVSTLKWITRSSDTIGCETRPPVE